MKFSLVKLLQVFFRLFMIFMLVFVWVRYYSNNVNFAIWLSVFITLVIEVIFKIIKQKKLAKLGLKQSEIKLAESVINKLIFNSQTENVNLFFKILQNHENVQKNKNYLTVTNPQNEIFVLFPFFSFAEFSVDNLAQVFQKVKKQNIKRLIICTSSASKQAQEISKKASFEVMILQAEETYAKLFKAYNYQPENDQIFKTETISKDIKLKDIAKNAIKPNKTKSYFFSSVILLFASYFVPYKIYYIVVASFLLILSIISFSSIWWKKQNTKQIF